MYLKKVFKYSKSLFLFMVFFALCQLFINYKQGVVISPFYHYGMYSEVIIPERTYAVTAIYVDGNKLQAKNFSPQEWDNIMLAASMFTKQKDWNSFLWNTDIKRMLRLTDSSKYINTLTDSAFTGWYKGYLSGKLGHSVKAVSIAEEVYDYHNAGLLQNKTGKVK